MTNDYTSTAEVPQTNTLALVSLISGLASWVVLPIIGSLVAVITGHMAKREIRESMGAQTGDGFATAGLILGYLNLGFGLVVICLIIAAIAMGLSIAFCVFPFSTEFSTLISYLVGI